MVGVAPCVVFGFRVVGAGVFSLPLCWVNAAWGCCLSLCWFLLSDWICCSILMVLCSRRVFWSRIVALVVRRLFMVAAMLAISVCIRCSVSVRLELLNWLVLLSKGA